MATAVPVTLDHLYLAAAYRRRKCDAARERRAAIEGDWRTWLGTIFPGYASKPFAPYHAEFWAWVWALRAGERARPFIAIWPRGHAKSTSVELACALVAATGRRAYALYVGETQEQADDHVSNVAGMLENAVYASYYPEAASRKVGKYGNARGWRRNRLRTASGFTLDAIGLDTAARGVKMDEDRPDLIIFDDVDGKLDTAAATEKKITTLTHTLIPAGSDAPAVLGVQNLVIADGVFAQLADGRADFLADRIVSGPHPAVENLTYEQRDGKTVITGGDPTWPALTLADHQADVDSMGITAYLAEKQHDVEPPPGGMFDHLAFRRCAFADVPDLVRAAVSVDPAVTDTDQSDAHGVYAAGIAADRRIYVLRSWENRTSPEDALRRALVWAVELGADTVVVETDQGGDTWESVYAAAWRRLVEDGTVPAETRRPTFKQQKAGGRGPKTERAGKMLTDYERDLITHVTGTHDVLERALRRFPKTKPFDLVDAAYWGWDELRSNSVVAVAPVSITSPSTWGRV